MGAVMSTAPTPPGAAEGPDVRIPRAEPEGAFYDIEYFLTMEARYLSGAHSSRVRNILRTVGAIDGLRVLDVGCGGGYFVEQFSLKGAQCSGVDYSPHAVAFAKNRYPSRDVRLLTGYELGIFEPGSFDVVTLIDVIEHVADAPKLLSEIKHLLKPGGRLIISTDAEDSPWARGFASRIWAASQRFSSAGRAYRMLKRIEQHRKRFVKDYHQSHINCLSPSALANLVKQAGYRIVEHRNYPLVGVPIRDAFLRLAPERFRGDHQCLAAVAV
jgi:SAM-dependent methyltransferase